MFYIGHHLKVHVLFAENVLLSDGQFLTINSCCGLLVKAVDYHLANLGSIGMKAL